MIKLKLCPFCGGEAEIMNGFWDSIDDNDFMKFISCTDCGAELDISTNRVEDAITAWNKRHNEKEE